MLLAIDTTSLVSTVALAVPDRILAELTVQTRKTHSERLMPHIRELLRMADAAAGDITALAVSVGPGSFTGLRIGLATAKALAFAWQIPIVGVSTLEALAYGCFAPGHLLSPLLDAQKENVYQAVYQWNEGEIQVVTAPRVAHHEQALGELEQWNIPVLVMGEAAVMYKEKIAALNAVTLVPPHAAIPRAAAVAMLGYRMLNQGITHDVMTLEPDYIRRSEAEVLWEKRHGASL